MGKQANSLWLVINYIASHYFLAYSWLQYGKAANL